jgi:uncharacterized protein (TIGR01777 family)
MSKRILITGATGMLGKRLVASLERDGHDVVATSRDRARAQKTLGDSVECFAWDYQHQPFPVAALAGVSAVYHLMGENIGTGRWTAGKKKALRESRILSTQKLVAALTDDVTDFFCASAIGIYPGDTHEPFDESSPLPTPNTFMTRLCTDWEEAAAAAITSKRRQASLRIGLVLAESGMLAPLVPIYRLGLGGPIGDGSQKIPWVHIEDLVNMMRFVLEHRELSGPINLVGPEPVSLKTFGETLARNLGRPSFIKVPSLLVRAALGEASSLLLSSYNILPTRLIGCGFAFRYQTHSLAQMDILEKFY